MGERTWLLEQFKTHSLKIAKEGEEFTLASGAKSRIYFDVKKTAMQARIIRPLGLALSSRLSLFLKTPNETLSAVAGVVLGGCHLATSIAVTSPWDLDVIYVRKETKDHGTGNCVEAPAGDPKEGGVVVIEDVVTTGNSALRAARRLRSMGYTVKGVLAVLDRRPVRDQPWLHENLPLHALYGLEDFGVQDLV